MRRTWTTILALGLVGLTTLFTARCGGTSGGLGDTPTGVQTVNTSCSPDSNCLSLTVSPRFLAADNTSVAGFKAVLRDGSGNFLAGAVICFHMEDPGVATIFEPVDGCGTSDGSGAVSGQLRARDRTGSVALVAEATRLEARQTIAFGQSCLIRFTDEAGLSSGDTLAQNESGFIEACIDCADNTTLVGATVAFSGCGSSCSISPTSATSDDAGCAGATVLNTNAAASPVQVNVRASESSSGSDTLNLVMAAAPTPTPVPSGTPLPTGTPVPTGTPLPTPTPGGVGAACSSEANCQSGLFCSVGDCAATFPGDTANTCRSRRVTGDCCTFNSECISGTCTGAGTCM